ncbi:MAG: hypothetical protein HOP15_12095 [Planctomycetes bacterium]|nr:hypothetical protein [Planctomycetota bacterium]
MSVGPFADKEMLMSFLKATKVLVLAVPVMLAGVAAGQTQRTKLFRQVRGPMREAHVDLATGVYTRGPSAHDRGGSTIADFQNLDVAGFLSVDTGGGSCRWFSSASKGAGTNQSQNASDLMSDVVFFYCSNALDVSSGGAGGSVTLGFYEGYTVFGGAPTTTAALVSLTGMPANTSQGSWLSPGAACYGLRVIFPTLVPFADGVFMGYSWQFDDRGTDGILGNTYPLLACVASCSGLAPGSVDGQGMQDLMDKFCTAPLVQSTFTFGTAMGTITSVNMEIREASDLAATNVNYNASLTPNTDLLSATKAILGTPWTVTLSRIPATVAGTLTLTLKRAKHPLPNGGVAGSPPFGRVLVAGALLTTLTGAHNGSTGSVAVGVPLEFAYCGLHFTAQARSTGGGVANIRLSSAVEATIGTF